ncbi:DUF262 domain-containing protein [Epilithonimonas ginsengisoli]|uniref:DUF262 domain-containing protein n=1 Tax=Epilithonimonas ginsengisoli TaxID=1245592 RepID=A0ABU4JGT6_9FLAO|nr:MULTISPECIES: DUF262 domain-containing protein [Chryseobacterium group]MBV6878797.1 DUF262 domain-containing protein [Epilithonimonas sp. FP105]MDW8548872.1 DUF262 domain-containing protein [Epilithonimonas ginsengisoli]OAH72353.1 hypothetical protein AXA65_10455 [Chryseobacterium sp. FP211-J200]
MSNHISIKSVQELLDYQFFIPSYQRGYRWTQTQVKDLLNDIDEFSPKDIANSSDGSWYCLQPIVVKAKDEKENNNLSGLWYDVIDGQQRLTTIYLIIKYFDDSTSNPFSIKYETRELSEEFLTNIFEKTKENSSENIDFHHIYNAFRTINKWFENKTLENKVAFCEKFKLFSKVIWYETSGDSIDVFTRINSGKIPLTNAELIKALFLNSSNFKNVEGQIDFEKLRLKQLEIASEWDRIEYALQNDTFWLFVNKAENNLPTRIEFMFDLIFEIEKEKSQTENFETFGNDNYSTFRFFADKFKVSDQKTIEDNWKQVKNYFQTLEEWFNDRELYHKVGYLITVGENITKILALNRDLTKNKFKEELDSLIMKRISHKKSIEELIYGSDNSQIIRILLLHNVLTTLKSEDQSLKFPFDKYKDKKKGGWSLEHIHAQNSEEITEVEDFENWLGNIDVKLLHNDLQNEISNFHTEKTKEKIPVLIKDISVHFGDTEVHSIENMALLSKNDNSKLNNGIFPVKRERIISLEKEGAFILISTKKVFQKYYEGCTKQISKWEETDRESYLNDIKQTLKPYLQPQKVTQNEQ